MALLRTTQERIDGIINDTDDMFYFEQQNVEDVQDFENGIFENNILYIKTQRNELGRRAVTDNLAAIEGAAVEFGISASVVKAVIYAENSRGWYDALTFGTSSSVLPGNINEIWEPLLPGSDVDNVSDNIRLTTKLLSEIAERLQDPRIEDVYSLYNSIAHDRTYENAETKNTPYFVKQVLLAEAWNVDSWVMPAYPSSNTGDGVDWSLVEANLNVLYGFDDNKLAAALADMATARSLGGQWVEDFFDEYGHDLAFDQSECFPANTAIALADGTRKPISDIRIGDEVLSFKPDGTLIVGKVDKLFRNTTQEFVRLEFDDGRDDLIATPGHRFLTETGDFMEIGLTLRLGGGAARLVDADGSIIQAQGEVLVYSAETAHLFEQAESRAIVDSGNLAVKIDTEAGWATYNFEVRETHTYIAGDIRVHNDSILSFLQEGDALYSVTDDLKDAAVSRDVDGDGQKEIVLLDGERFDGTGSSTFLEVTQVFTPSNANADVEALLAQFINNNPEAASNVYDPGNGNNPGDGIASDDIVEILTDDIGGTFSARQFGGVPVPSLAELVSAAVTGGAQGLIQTLFTPLAGSPGTIDYASGDGDQTLEPAGPDSLSILLFILGLDASEEIVPGIPSDSPFFPDVPGITLGDILSDMDLPDLGTFEVSFGAGITQDDVTRAQVGNDLVLTIENADGSTNTLTLENVYSNGNADEIVAVNFIDGSEVELTDLEITNANEAPVLDNALVDQSSLEVDAVSFTLPANAFSDPDGDALTLTALLADDSALPSWLSFDGSTFTGTPPPHFVGTLELKVTASDGDLSVSDIFTLDITNVNDAPIVAQEIADTSISEGGALNYTVPAGTFTDIDGDALTLTATLSNGDPLPGWLSFNSNSGTFSGTPPIGSIGVLNLLVSATDGSAAVSDEFVLTITEVNDAPVVANALVDQSSLEDNAVSFALPANAFSDPDGDTLTLTALLADDSALPSWLLFDGSTFTGTPPQHFFGTVELKVIASDGELSVSDIFTLDITNVNDAPVVGQEIADIDAAEGLAFSYSVPATAFADVDGDVLTLSATLSNGDPLPSWLTFDANTGAFSGTPPVGSIGALNIIVTAIDGVLSVSDEFVLNITEDTTPTNNIVNDDNTTTQYLNGTALEDVFVIDALSTEYGWAPTRDGTGTVIWLIGGTPGDHDILFNNVEQFENVQFNDRTVDLVSEPSSPGTITQNVVTDDPTTTQYLSGTADEDVFVINGSSSEYDWAPTQDGTGTVIWLIGGTPQDHDIMFSNVEQFEKVQFTDRTVDLVSEPSSPGTNTQNVVTDDPTTTQYLSGTVDEDVFVIDASSSEYDWAPTQDGTGTVIWLIGGTPQDHDILFNNIEQFENVQFNDRTVNLVAEPSSPDSNTQNVVTDDPATTQYLSGTADEDVFVINASSLEYGWAPTQDGSGTVVWLLGGTPQDHDILYSNIEQFETIQFNDRTVVLQSEPTSIVLGTSGDDTGPAASIQGSLGNDIIQVSTGNDEIDGGDGIDLFNVVGEGSAVTDFTYSTNADGDLVMTSATFGSNTLSNIENVNFQEDNVIKTVQELIDDIDVPINTITGTSGVDYLSGTNQNDLLIGLGGNDVFFETQGNDTYDGGSGYNQVNYDGSSSDFIFVENSDGSVTATHTSTNKVDTLIDIGGIWFNGEGAWYDLDSLTVPAPPTNTAPIVAAALIDQSSVEDTAINFTVPASSFSDADGDALTLSATLADGSALPTWLSFDGTTFTGTPPLDYVGTLNIEVTATDGVDDVSDVFDLEITADTTSDTDTITGTSAADDLSGTTGADVIDGLGGSDIINGLGGTDIISGGSGKDTINGGGGKDTINGNGGNDTISGDNGADTLYGDGGADTLYGDSGADTLYGDSGEDTLYGGTGKDTISGGTGKDTLYGENGIDTIYGDNGDDNITGGLGNDILYGGDGADNFYFSSGDGQDTIEDNGNGDTDKIFIQGYNATDATFEDNGDDLIITFNGSNDSITVKNTLGGSSQDQIEQFIFDDGTLTVDQIKSAIDDVPIYNEIFGTNGVDYMSETDADDIMYGLAGEDVFYFSKGNDVYDGGGDEYDQVNYAGSANDYSFSGNTDGSVTVTSAAYGTDTLISIDGIWFEGQGAWYGIDDLLI